MGSDYQASARFFTQSLLSDPTNPSLLENAMSAYVSLGQISRAAPISDRMLELGIASQLAALVRYVEYAAQEEWDNVSRGVI